MLLTKGSAYMEVTVIGLFVLMVKSSTHMRKKKENGKKENTGNSLWLVIKEKKIKTVCDFVGKEKKHNSCQWLFVIPCDRLCIDARQFAVETFTAKLLIKKKHNNNGY